MYAPGTVKYSIRGNADNVQFLILVLKICKRIERVLDMLRLNLALRVISKENHSFGNEFSRILSELAPNEVISDRKKSYLNLKSVHRKWLKGSENFMLGHYTSGTKWRIAALEEVYEFHGIDISSSYYPPLISDGYIGAIGHLGVLMLHQECRGFELPVGQRVIIEPKRIGNRQVYDFVKDNDVSVPIKGFNTTNSLFLTSLVENLEIIKSKQGFVGLYDLTESFADRQRVNSIERRRKLRTRLESRMPDYSQKAVYELTKIGVDLSAPFIILHVRSAKSGNDSRGASIISYVPSIQFLTELGIQVIRVGSFEKSFIAYQDKNFFDLAGIPQSSELLLYLMLHANGFIGTTSGPYFLSLLLDCPTLVTNLTSAGRNSFSFPKALYLPKSVIIDGNFGTLSQHLSGALGLGEMSNGHLRRQHIELRENTKEQLLGATKEFFDLLGTHNWDAKRTIDNVRFGAVTRGNFANAFLEQILN